MLSKIYSGAVVGLEAKIIEIEVNTSYGLRKFEVVGLPDKAVQESRERVGAALKNAGFKSPHQKPVRVLVSLAPADIKKEGSLYDLPIAVGYLAAEEKIKLNTEKTIILGELGLDGSLKKIKGTLPIVMEAKEKGFKRIILPQDNTPEASLIKGLEVIGVRDLNQAINFMAGRINIEPAVPLSPEILKQKKYPLKLEWIKGQEYAKRALEISAAGAHHLFMMGPPGTGKSLLAKAVPSILPPLSHNESLEVTKIYSIAGLLHSENPLVTIRPFRAPHHTASESALIGGGTPPRPGEITLAHRGVLFLDEFPEFHRDVLESLRQPIEEGVIIILRAKHRLTLPARFILIAASNPCPCGYFGDPEKKCICGPSQIAKYRRKLSGPLMDRVDLFINVPSLKYEKLTAPEENESSEKIREKIQKARKIQEKRFRGENILTNSEMSIFQIKKYCQIDSKSSSLLRKYVDSRKLSARGYHRVLKVARTIADLDEAENISFTHLAEAIMYRLNDEESYLHLS
ncbi:MAG: YifB family Mg chelatase-like AAA ATPase [Thermodesulfobacterium sp.]|nr:YifB family Mg chelatase-like AAA ATPase [Thermodesulfobacterium sp.]